jgi:predicted amidohydrolase YtcJ
MVNGDAADLIVLGAQIYTVDDARVAPQAFSVRGGRFAHVGSLEEALTLRGSSTEVLELNGYTVLPGFVDAHLHLTNLGLTLEQADLRGVGSYEELVQRTVEFSDAAGDEWILGRGWDENLWRSKAFPVHDALTAAIPDRPVALVRVDGHALLANAQAMAIAGIDESTPDPPGGRILRDDRGKPTGLLVDTAEALVHERVPPPTHARLVRATRAAIAECNRWGITAVAEPGCDDAVLAAHVELIESGDYSMRNYAMLHGEPALIEQRERDGILDGAYDGRLWIRAIKIYADGALGSRGAALLEPYTDDPANDGIIVTPRHRIEALVERAFRSGLQPCVHAIGDRANRMVLDVYDAALRRAGSPNGLRPRIEHAQVLAPSDVPRFGKLGVIASMQAVHGLSDLRWAEERLGPERVRGAYAWRPLIDAGAIVANGTDAPVESPSTPRSFFASIAAGSDPQRLMTRGEALASMTISAAYANFQERAIGSISPGKYADFVIVDRDWMNVAPDAIEASNILATYFGGRCVYASPAFRQTNL